MPTREDMNSAGQPFLALRREAEAPNQPPEPQSEVIRHLQAALASKDERITELEVVAGEWQAIAADLRQQNDKLRQELTIDKDEIIAQLQALVSSGCAKREAQAREISRLQEAVSALRRLEAVAYPPVRADPWDTFGVEELEKMLTARERRVQVPGAVLVSPDGSTERVQPVDLVVTVDPAKPGADATAISHWVDGKPLRPHTFNSFTHICEACGLTEEEAMHPGTIRGCAG